MIIIVILCLCGCGDPPVCAYIIGLTFEARMRYIWIGRYIIVIIGFLERMRANIYCGYVVVYLVVIAITSHQLIYRRDVLLTIFCFTIHVQLIP